MGKILKEGKVVIVLKGRFAGRKAVVVRDYDGSKKDAKSFPKVLLAGIDKAPLKVTRSMSNKKVSRRTHVKPFIKFVNQNHVMPTRYGLEEDKPKSSSKGKNSGKAEMSQIAQIVMANYSKNREDFNAKKAKTLARVRSYFENRFKSGKNPWFFSKLRF